MATNTGRRAAGTVIERYGWVLLALLSAVIVVFGVEAFLAQDSADAAIQGSACCTGQRFSEAPSWTYEYGIEMARYMGTYMVGTGVFGLAVVLAGLRHARRWAWAVCWYVPVLFAVHGFVLGSFPFDIPTLALGVLGLLLMIRPVFAAPGARTGAAAPEPVGAAAT